MIQRLSKLLFKTTNESNLLLKSGLIKKSSSGLYSILPMGLVIINKLKSVLDSQLLPIASKVELNTLLSAALWKQTGRFEMNDLFKLKDCKSSDYLLAPTHEEEITNLLKEMNQISPIKVYQIGTKYRDEKRPRLGLTRTKEFIMMDLYSIDHDILNAQQTYFEMIAVFDKIFNLLHIPFTRVEADMGQMGGLKSHEYQFIHELGEDSLIICSGCDYAANDENAIGKINQKQGKEKIKNFIEYEKDIKSVLSVFVEKTGSDQRVSENRDEVVDSLYNDSSEIIQKIQMEYKIEKSNDKILILPIHHNLNHTKLNNIHTKKPIIIDSSLLPEQSVSSMIHINDIKTIKANDTCINCNSPLKQQKSIEIGHAFLLGDLYSSKLKLTTNDKPFQMGCFGIGVSRLLQVIAMHSHDAKGLIWNTLLTPYKVWFIEQGQTGFQFDDIKCFNRQDYILDDRSISIKIKIKDAYLVGCPIIIIVGKDYIHKGLLEVHYRSTGKIINIPESQLPLKIKEFYSNE